MREKEEEENIYINYFTENIFGKWRKYMDIKFEEENIKGKLFAHVELEKSLADKSSTFLFIHADILFRNE